MASCMNSRIRKSATFSLGWNSYTTVYYVIMRDWHFSHDLGWIFPRSQEGTRDGEYAYYYCIFITWYEQGRMQQLHVHVHVYVWTQAFLVTYWLVSFIAIDTFKFMLNVQSPLLVRLYLVFQNASLLCHSTCTHTRPRVTWLPCN